MIAFERQAISCVCHHFEMISLYAIGAANGVGIGHKKSVEKPRLLAFSRACD